MRVIPTAIDGVLILEPKVIGDARGFFMESFNQRAFDAAVGAPTAASKARWLKLSMKKPRASPITFGSRISTPSIAVGITRIRTPCSPRSSAGTAHSRS